MEPLGSISLADLDRHVRGAFSWIDSVAHRIDDGSAWLDGDQLGDDLYAGTASVLFGCAEATASGFDTTQIAAGAVARLQRLAMDGQAMDGQAARTLPDDGLFTGWAGVAAALRAWSAVTGDHSSRETAERVTHLIAERVHAMRSDRRDCPDIISGDAGVLLALLAGDEIPTNARIAGAANILADRLLSRAEDGPHGPAWRMDANQDHLYPGFSHGTSGVAYSLAAAGRVLHRPDLIDVAVAAAERLLELGNTPEGWALPLSIPRQPHRPAVFFGWCHGPTGTLRLFLLLDAMDPRPRWQKAVAACMRALASSGLPARHYPGFWDNLGRCCGTAGVGKLLVDRYQVTGETELLEWSMRLAADVVGRTVETATGLTWSNTEHTRTPPDLPPEPGLMQGAAGIAGWLARLHAVGLDRDAAAVPTGLEPSWI